MTECTRLLVTSESEVAVVKGDGGYILTSINLPDGDFYAKMSLDELQEVYLALGELLEREL